jgi:hypothetical protein
MIYDELHRNAIDEFYKNIDKNIGDAHKPVISEEQIIKLAASNPFDIQTVRKYGGQIQKIAFAYMLRKARKWYLWLKIKRWVKSTLGK